MTLQQTIHQIDPAALDMLKRRLQGQIIEPGDEAYDSARAVWNGMIDHYPLLIVRIRTAADAMTTVQFAREQSLPVSVRGGGHNVAGSAVVDGGIVIDLSEMKNIHVDPVSRTARAEGGVIWRELDAATQQHGLAAPGGLVSDTGIAGLTLGGGYGSLRRKHGLSSDNLIGAQIVTSDGRLLHVSETEQPDLLWALRGGGGVGVVTSFEYHLYPVGPEVATAIVFYDGDDAPNILRRFRSYTQTSPDEVSAIAVLGWFPDVESFPVELHHRRFVAVLAPYIGDPVEGERVIQPLRELAEPLLDISGVLPYVEVQKFFDADYPAGEMRYYWKSLHFDGLTDETIDRLAELGGQMASHHSTIDLWHLGGAINRIAPTATAFPHRTSEYMVGIEANWHHDSDDVENLAWAKRTNDVLLPLSNGGRYLNFPGLWEEGSSQLSATWGVNSAKMREVRAQYDPHGMFTPGK